MANTKKAAILRDNTQAPANPVVFSMDVVSLAVGRSLTTGKVAALTKSAGLI